MKRPRLSHGRVAAVIAWLAAILTVSQANCRALTMTFADADFTPAWQTTTLPTTNGQAIFTSVVNATVDGNPPEGNYLDVLILSGTAGQIAEGFIFDSSMVFDPANMFDISTVDFSADMFRDSGAVGSFAIQQNGTYYYSAAFNSTPSAVWQNQQISMAAANFTRYFEVTGTGGATPDFSPSGAPITLGFYAQIAGFFSQNTGTLGFDTFSATVNYTQIPEASVPGVLGFSAMWFCARRRRR